MAERDEPVRADELGGTEPDGSRPWLLVDVRTPGEFRAAHIEGAVNVPLGSHTDQVQELVEQACERPIALICRTGERARRAKRDFDAHCAGRARVLDGGVVAWEQAGQPLVRGEGGMSLERQVRIAAGSLVVVATLLGTLVHEAFFGLGAFVGAGLVFAGLTDTCAMGMLLARMPWNTRVDRG